MMCHDWSVKCREVGRGWAQSDAGVRVQILTDRGRVIRSEVKAVTPGHQMKYTTLKLP